MRHGIDHIEPRGSTVPDSRVNAVLRRLKIPIPGILAPLVGRARRLVLTSSRNPRAAAPAELEKLAPPALSVVVAPSIREALAIAEAQEGTPILCVAGSLSLVGDALAEIGGNRDKPCPVENAADSMGALS